MQARVERAIAALNPVVLADAPPAAMGAVAGDADEPMVVVEEEMDEGDLHEDPANGRVGVLGENGDLHLGGAIAAVAAAFEGELDEDAASVGGVVEVAEQRDGLDDSSVFLDGLGEFVLTGGCLEPGNEQRGRVVAVADRG
jgi:hypothetical protein